jgi:hypothetical protein
VDSSGSGPVLTDPWNQEHEHERERCAEGHTMGQEHEHETERCAEGHTMGQEHEHETERCAEGDRKSTRLNSSHVDWSGLPTSGW